MTNAVVIANINNFSEEQKAYFNQVCNSKIFNDDRVNISRILINEAKDTAVAVNLLTETAIENNISPSLDYSNKLSQRPC